MQKPFWVTCWAPAGPLFGAQNGHNVAARSDGNAPTSYVQSAIVAPLHPPRVPPRCPDEALNKGNMAMLAPRYANVGKNRGTMTMLAQRGQETGEK